MLTAMQRYLTVSTLKVYTCVVFRRRLIPSLPYHLQQTTLPPSAAYRRSASPRGNSSFADPPPIERVCDKLPSLSLGTRHGLSIHRPVSYVKGR